jgi:hypothetical protein
MASAALRFTMSESAARSSPSLPVPDRRRRGGAVALLALYCWIAAIFPVLHAAAEQASPASVAAGDTQPSAPLPSGHDHLTCHFCTSAGTLVSPPSVIAVELPSWRVTPIPVHQTAIVSQVLAWTHHAIPPRAPPLG